MFFVTENCVAMGGSALSTAVNPWVQFEKKIKKGVVFVVFLDSICLCDVYLSMSGRCCHKGVEFSP